MACSGCGKKRAAEPVPTLRIAVPVDMTEEEVVWRVQPMGMTVYTTRNQQRYMVYKRGQTVKILRADHEELAQRGLI